MAEPRLRYGRIGSPEGVALEDETGAEVLRVAGGAAVAPLADYGGEKFNVKTFGAVGDGVANDTAAIAAAIDAAAPVRGVVFFPPGTYMTDRQFIPSGVTVQGSGRGTLIKLRPRVMTEFKHGGVLNATGTAEEPVIGAVFRSFRISSNRGAHTYTSEASATNTEGLELEYAIGVLVEDVHAEDCESEGFDLDYSYGCKLLNCTADTCGGWGVHISTECGPNVVDSVVARNCGIGTPGVLAAGRGGFDQHFSATGTTYINLRAIDCHKPYQIHGTNATVVNCEEEGTPVVPSTFNGARMMVTPRRLIAASPSVTAQTVQADETAVVASRSAIIGSAVNRAAIIASSTAEVSAVTAALLATTGSTASGERSVVAASADSEASGVFSAVIASSVSNAGRDRSAVVASSGSDALAYRSFIAASQDCMVAINGTRGAVLASNNALVSADRGAIIGSNRSTASATNAVVLAAAGVENNVANSVAGGVSGSAASPSGMRWRLGGLRGSIWLHGYTRTGLPSAATLPDEIVRVTDPEAGKSALVISTGTGWVYVGDGSVVTGAPA